MGKSALGAILSILFLVFCISSAGAQALFLADTPVITEFLASNDGSLSIEQGGLLDEDGDDSDWIELYNPGAESIDLDGWFLTDNADNLKKWMFPAQSVLEPGQFLVVFASSKNRRNLDSSLHTNFQLSSAGEYLALVQPDGLTVASAFNPVYPEQLTNISFGYTLVNEVLIPQYFSTPTPGVANIEGTLGWTEPISFSHQRGFYEDPFELTISTDTEGAEIHVTLDGTMPSATHGFIYNSPMSIAGTTFIRAIAVKPGYADSESVTQTYVFLSDVIQQSLNGQAPGPDWPAGQVNGQIFEYGLDKAIVTHATWGPQLKEALLSIPSLSLVTDPKHLFDRSTGIYVNAEQRGREWERPMSLELIYPEAPEGAGFPDLKPTTTAAGEAGQWALPEAMKDGFQINAGVRIRGGFSRNDRNPKHAFRVFFRSEYGQGELKYPLFGSEGSDHFDNIDLRTSQNYSWSFDKSPANAMCREVWARDSQGVMGQPYTRSRYYHLYLNGQYWGIYQTQERSEASHGAAYLGGNREDYDTIKSTGSDGGFGGGFGGGYTIEATDGSMAAWQSVWDQAKAGFGSPASYNRVQGLNPDGTRNPDFPVLLDLDNLIDYMIMVFYDGDRDAPISNFLQNQRPNNWFGIRNRHGDEGFKFFMHDAEHIMSQGMEDRTGPFSAGDEFIYSNPQWVHQQLMANPDYCIRFADRAQKYLFNDGLLTPDKAIERLEARAEQIDMAIIAESARWGGATLNKTTWQNAVNREKTQFMLSRSTVLVKQFQKTRLRSGDVAPLYPNVAAASFGIDGGQVAKGAALSISAQQGNVYYTLDGSDPRLSQLDSMLTLVPEQATKQILVLTEDPGATFWAQWFMPDQNDTAWMSASGAVGFDLESGAGGYHELIDQDVQSQMYGINGSCLIRIPFTLDEDPWKELALYVRYDDGFIAYLNGVEILSVNLYSFRGRPAQWNARASIDRADTLARVFEGFDITNHKDLLREGDNVLAILGLNFNMNDADFLLSAKLLGQKGGVTPSPTAMAYSGPVTLDHSVCIKARVFDSMWSAMSEAAYSVGPVAQSLGVTEIMYHPLDTGMPNDANSEYIELENHGQETIDLGLVQWTVGIRFTFPTMDLAPGSRVLVVKDIAAFEAVYGLGHVIAGQYEGSLSNKGEQLVLQDAAGQVIADFEYKDSWYNETDGQGFSLTLVEPVTGEFNPLSQKSAWRASTTSGGSPGF